MINSLRATPRAGAARLQSQRALELHPPRPEAAAAGRGTCFRLRKASASRWRSGSDGGHIATSMAKDFMTQLVTRRSFFRISLTLSARAALLWVVAAAVAAAGVKAGGVAVAPGPAAVPGRVRAEPGQRARVGAEAGSAGGATTESGGKAGQSASGARGGSGARAAAEKDMVGRGGESQADLDRRARTPSSRACQRERPR